MNNLEKMWQQVNWKELATDLLFDIVGSALFAAGVYNFASQGGFAPGGVSGMALLVNHYLPFLPLGAIGLLLNIPIILCTVRLLGRRFFLASMKSLLISTLFLDYAAPLLPVYSGDRLLSAVFAGLLMGAGLAFIFMRGSSTGGADFIVAAIKKKKPHLSFGQIVMVSDAVVICLGWLVYGDIDAVLYGLIAVVAETVVMDKLLYGAGGGKLVIVVTDFGAEMTRQISAEIGRGSTLVAAVGGYTGQSHQMLYCACSRSEVYQVRRIASRVDPYAMVMICDATEVLGEGFAPIGEKN